MASYGGSLRPKLDSSDNAYRIDLGVYCFQLPLLLCQIHLTLDLLLALLLFHSLDHVAVHHPLFLLLALVPLLVVATLFLLVLHHRLFLSLSSYPPSLSLTF